MAAAACRKWSGLFSVGEEDFDEEDLLEADWKHASEPPSATGTSAASHSAPLQESASSSTVAPSASSELGSLAPSGAHPQPSTVFKGLRSLSNPSSSSHSTSAPQINAASLRVSSAVSSLLPIPDQPKTPPAAMLSNTVQADDFDDWDVDLEELDESLLQKFSGPQAASVLDADSVCPVKRMRSSAVVEDTPVKSSLRGFCNTTTASRPPQCVARTPCSSTFAPRAPPQSPYQPFERNISSACRFSSPRGARPSPECQRGAVTPRAPLQESLFQAISPAPSQTHTPRPLHTPVLTNHLVQLVSAASKTPQRPRSSAPRPKTRRFPGPAGALPQQISRQNLDDIVVSVPQTPAHGAVARLRNEASSSQSSEVDEFSGGPWAAMKAEMGLDERNPSCFLHSYSIVMVLRKAALRQLAKNKVPNMAVVLKSILHTHADAKAVFRDPTGEIQGTLHRRLLEDRQGELKTGAVLLLKQVGVFSPSHRNHYLNVTPNNLLKIYSPDGTPLIFSQHSQPLLGAAGLPQWDSPRPQGGPVSQMELHYCDDDDDETELEKRESPAAAPISAVVRSSGPEDTEEALWGADDFDELLGELPFE